MCVYYVMKSVLFHEMEQHRLRLRDAPRSTEVQSGDGGGGGGRGIDTDWHFLLEAIV